MKKRKRIGRLEIRQFLRDGLKSRISADLRRRRIASEADLHSCTYLHLRRFLRRDPRWTVFNKAYIKNLSVYPDLVLKRRNIPRIAIELKEKRRLTPRWFKGDLRKLQRLWVKGRRPITGYFICLVRQDEKEMKLQRLAKGWRSATQRQHIFPIIINAHDHVRDWKAFQRWWKKHAKTDLDE